MIMLKPITLDGDENENILKRSVAFYGGDWMLFSEN